MLEYLIDRLLVVILLVVVFLYISLKKRKEIAGIDSTKLSGDITAKIRDDVSKAVRETVSEVPECVGGVSGTLKSVVELFEKNSHFRRNGRINRRVCKRRCRC